MEAATDLVEIVMYHYVKDRKRKPHETHLTLDAFRQQLDYFASVGQIIHPDALHTPDEGRASGSRKFLLSFDDGLLDHYAVVYPELKRRGLSALFFINDPTYRTKRLLNVHRLHALLQHQSDSSWMDQAFEWAALYPLLDHARLLFERVGYQGLQEEEKVKRLKVLLNFCLSFEDQEAILQQLMDRSNLDEQQLSAQWYLTDNMVRDMHRGGMVFGSHGSAHYLLSNWPVARQRADIDGSLRWLRALLPGSSPSFCYPYGYREAYNKETMEVLQQSGVTLAFEVENRVYDASQHISRLQIPRKDCVHYPPISN